MKKIFIALALCAGLCACNSQSDPKVMARHVPERADDFVFENNLIAGRIYGKALEGNPTSPGIDIWVKMPGKLVANEWYAAAILPPRSRREGLLQGGCQPRRRRIRAVYRR